MNDARQRNGVAPLGALGSVKNFPTVARRQQVNADR
jgi:hypothetical protein